MSRQSGGSEGPEVIIIFLVAGLLALYFSKYILFFFWIPTKIVELWAWSFFQPSYTTNLVHFVDSVTVKKLHWNQANYINGQVLSIAGHGWMKPIAFLQTGLDLLLLFLLFRKVRGMSMRPVKNVQELVTLQKQQFPWGSFWLNKPRERTTAMRPHEVFGKNPDFQNTFQVLSRQLGRRNLDFGSLDKKEQALYGALVLQISGKIDDAQAALRALALGNLPEIPQNAAEDWRERMQRFHFERTCFVDALFHARAQNLLPPSWFNWLKIENRGLWMALTSTPPYRQVIKPFRAASEAVGPLSWWIYAQNRTIEENIDHELQMAFGGINTLDETLKEVDYVG